MLFSVAFFRLLLLLLLLSSYFTSFYSIRILHEEFKVNYSLNQIMNNIEITHRNTKLLIIIG